MANRVENDHKTSHKTMRNINAQWNTNVQKCLHLFILWTYYKHSHHLPYSIYDSTGIKFGCKRMNVLPKAVMEKWIAARAEKKEATLPRILWVLWKTLFYFSSNIWILLSQSLWLTTTVCYFLLVLLDSFLSSRCPQLLIYVFLLYLQT